jgi:DNA-binding beta-propeller fold protein YncE
MRGAIRSLRVLAGAAVLAVAAATALALAPGDQTVSPKNQVGPNGRHLTPHGKLVRLGNFPTGAAVTADGRFYWTVSSGYSQNDIRILDLRTGRVAQTIKLPGASGGVALDSARRLAYVSGVPDTDIRDFKTPAGTPGREGDVVHVFKWSRKTGVATFLHVIPIPPPDTAPTPQNFPPDPEADKRSWPERLDVSADGGTLLVALGLGDAAAIVDTKTKGVRYVETGSYPYGAAILPDGNTGLVSNRGPGTVSVIDLKAGSKVKDIQVGAHLSHPESIALDPRRARAYVPLANADGVAVVDTGKLELERTLSVAREQGAGTAPVDAAVSRDGRQLLVAESAADEVAVFKLPPVGGGGAPKLAGRIPTAAYPTDVDSIGAKVGSRCGLGTPRRRGRPLRLCPKLLWVAARGFGLGPNAGPPFTSQYFSIPAYLTTKGKVRGYAGIVDYPGSESLKRLTGIATAQLTPANRQSPPDDTPIRPNGPIKHVFYVVRENRTYDQVLGDDSRGDGEPGYAIFGDKVTPNAHTLAKRFPLLDRVYANSEASIDGHYWTAAATTSDYVDKTWRENYSGRGYPTDAWFYQIAYPQTGFIVDRADEQGVSWINLGEGVIHLNILPGDKDRSPEDQAGVQRRYSKSDLGALTPGGCYDPFIGSDDFADAGDVPTRLYDSSKPIGAPEPSLSRFDCFRTRFQRWVAEDSLPQLVYMTLPNNHTNGASANHHTPRAMVADNDLGLGQVVDLISHSKYWQESAIFVIEDDSQDGFDHHDAHRIPAFAISPYARRGAIVHTRYDFASVLRSVELILGLKPMNLFDAMGTPMYDAFGSTPSNSEPFDALPATYPILEENSSNPSSAVARAGNKYDTHVPDRIPQRLLDRVLWASVHGSRSKPPPPGPNAEEEDEREGDE